MVNKGKNPIVEERSSDTKAEEEHYYTHLKMGVLAPWNYRRLAWRTQKIQWSLNYSNLTVVLILSILRSDSPHDRWFEWSKPKNGCPRTANQGITKEYWWAQDNASETFRNSQKNSEDKASSSSSKQPLSNKEKKDRHVIVRGDKEEIPFRWRRKLHDHHQSSCRKDAEATRLVGSFDAQKKRARGRDHKAISCEMGMFSLFQ